MRVLTLALAVLLQTTDPHLAAVQVDLTAIRAEARTVLEKNATLKPKSRLPAWVTDAMDRVVQRAEMALAESQLIVLSGPPKTPPPVSGACDAANVAAGASGCHLFTESEISAWLTTGPTGGFCMPDTSNNGLWLDNSPGMGFAVDRADGTLWVPGGSDSFSGRAVAHLNVPTLVYATSAASLNKATYTSSNAFVEPTENRYVSSSDGVWPGDPTTSAQTVPTAILDWSSTEFCGSFQYYYENATPTTYPFYCRPKNQSSTGSVRGMGKFTDTNGATTRTMTAFCANIPTAWQTALGGSAFCGSYASYSIISNQTYGPSFCVMDFSGLGTHTNGSTSCYMYYPGSHQTVGGWDGYVVGEYMDFSTLGSGAIIIPNSRTALYLTIMGTPMSSPGFGTCYGLGLSDPDDPRIGTPTGDGDDLYCYDPTDSSKANHGYPYRYVVVAVDLNDLMKVKRGDINPGTGSAYQPWEITPYALVNFTFPISVVGTTNVVRVRGLALDTLNNRVMMGQGSQCAGGSPSAAIWVYPMLTAP